MERNLIERFLHKFVGVTIDDSGQQFFRRGYLEELTDESLVLVHGEEETVISLQSIREIRNLKNGN